MDGVINVLKSPGMTSRQVVSKVKGILKAKKVGHGGTLDPGACGVLPVFIGKATRLCDILPRETKEYVARFTFGIQTTTQDSFGTVVDRNDKVVTLEEIQSVLPKFVGEIEQTPSIYSAIHINGKRAYDYAFKGQSVKIPSRKVVVDELVCKRQTGHNEFLFKITCEKGFYVRSLCEDIAKELNTLGYMSALIRTKAFGFRVEDAVSIEALEKSVENYEQNVIDIETVLDPFPKLKTKKEFDKMLHNGNKVPLIGVVGEVQNQGLMTLYDSNDELYSLCYKDEEILRNKVFLR